MSNDKLEVRSTMGECDGNYGVLICAVDLHKALQLRGKAKFPRDLAGRTYARFPGGSRLLVALSIEGAIEYLSRSRAPRSSVVLEQFRAMFGGKLSVPISPVQPSPTPNEELSVRIDWTQFFTDDGLVSLRAMVEHGELYARFSDAVSALERSGLDFQKRRTPQNGSKDCLMAPIDAQVFAMRARTETGERIARVVASHHNAFQEASDRYQGLDPSNAADAGYIALLQNAERLVEMRNEQKRLNQEVGILAIQVQAKADKKDVDRALKRLGMADIAPLEHVRKEFNGALRVEARRLKLRPADQPVGTFWIDLNRELKTVVNGVSRKDWKLHHYQTAAKYLDSKHGVNVYWIFKRSAYATRLAYVGCRLMEGSGPRSRRPGRGWLMVSAVKSERVRIPPPSSQQGG